MTDEQYQTIIDRLDAIDDHLDEVSLDLGKIKGGMKMILRGGLKLLVWAKPVTE